MLVIPAIDIKNGKCVRLVQGDPERETVYHDDPVDMAKRFEDMGAKLIHVVDLDGAFQGAPVHVDEIARMVESLNVPIEVGGGIRTVESVRMYVDVGVTRIIAGTALLKNEFLAAIRDYTKYIIAGVDAKDSCVATHGWKSVSDMRAVDFIRELVRIGLSEVIYTDISTDGMLKGPNIDALNILLQEVPGIRLIASGGVSSIDDLVALRNVSPALKGCILGKAIYDGRINLTSALGVV